MDLEGDEEPPAGHEPAAVKERGKPAEPAVAAADNNAKPAEVKAVETAAPAAAVAAKKKEDEGEDDSSFSDFSGSPPPRPISAPGVIFSSFCLTLSM